VELRQRSDLGLDLPTKSRYVTFRRPISPIEEENARAIPPKQRRMTRQGAKHGLRSSIDCSHIEAVYDVYAESVRRLGSPVFPRRLFREIAEQFGKECRILSVWHRERLVAGVLTLFYEDQVLPYYGGALRDAFGYAVNDFMYWELMCHASRAGFRHFDFGRSREGTGAYEFKRHWGFSPAPLPYQYVLLRARRLPDLSPSNRRFRLATEVWKRLPLWLTNRLGPHITAYLP
jgi:FemAB-related protein (PEP-CTERM system-associated)